MPLVWRFDPRLKILLALWYSLWTWHLSPEGLTVLVGVLFAAVLLAPVRDTGLKLRSVLFFVGFWVFLKLGLDFFWPENVLPRELLWQNSLELGLRLLGVMLIGYLLAGVSTQIETAKAAGFLLKPVAWKRAWKVALTLALMLHYIPIVGRTATQTRQAMRLRCSHLSWHRRTGILVQSVLRTMGQTTWDQTLALVSRGMDRPEAWTELPKLQPSQVLTTLALAAPVFFML